MKKLCIKTLEHPPTPAPTPENVLCPVCNKTFRPLLGRGVFVEGTWDQVCQGCILKVDKRLWVMVEAYQEAP